MNNVVVTRRFRRLAASLRHHSHPIWSTLNPIKGENYFVEYFQSIEAIRLHQNSPNVCVEQRRYRLAVLVCVLFGLHHLWLIFVVNHPSEWLQLVACDYIDLFRVPILVPLHLAINVLIHIHHMHYVNYCFVHLKHYDIIKDILVGSGNKPNQFLFSIDTNKIKHKTIGLLQFSQGFIVFLGMISTSIQPINDEFIFHVIELLCICAFMVCFLIYLNEYSFWELLTWIGTFVMIASFILVSTFALIDISTLNTILCLSLCLTMILYERLNKNQQILQRFQMLTTRVKTNRQLPVRLLTHFQWHHIRTFLYFLDYHRGLSRVFFLQMILIYSYTSSQLASVIRDPEMNIQNVLLLSMVVGQAIGVYLAHLVAAHHSHKLHKPFTRFLPASSLGSMCSTKTRIRLALFGQQFHTNRRYGLQYGPFGLINMKAFCKVCLPTWKIESL